MNARHMTSPNLIQRLEAGLMLAAQLVESDPRALPVFERIDAELSAARATDDIRKINDPIEKARAMARVQREARI